MFDQPKISVICPVYNGENFLKDLIQSLSNQSFEDYEIIFVNDGSTDRTISLLNNYAENDARVRLFSKVNEGQAIARNFAIQKAQGKYLCFVDSDDFVDKEWLLCLYNCIKKGYDFGACDYKRVSSDGDIVDVKEKKFPPVKLYTNLEMINLLISSRVEGFSCNKIYVRDIVLRHNVVFYHKAKAILEDLFFNYHYLKNVQNCYLSDKVGLFYRCNANSTSQGVSERNLEAMKIRRILIEDNYSKFISIHLEVSNVVNIMNSLKYCYTYKNKVLYEKILAFFNERKYISIVAFQKMSNKNKFKYLLLRLNINFFLKV